MAIIYHPNFKQSFIYRGLSPFFSSFSCTIFAGVQPTAQTVADNWATYKNPNSNLLWHSNVGFTTGITNNETTIYGTLMPQNVLPVRAGTASWAIIWNAIGVDYNSLSSNTIPSTRFTVVPVTLNTSNGVLRVNNSSFTTSTAVIITEFGLTASL